MTQGEKKDRLNMVEHPIGSYDPSNPGITTTNAKDIQWKAVPWNLEGEKQPKKEERFVGMSIERMIKYFESKYTKEELAIRYSTLKEGG